MLDGIEKDVLRAMELTVELLREAASFNPSFETEPVKPQPLPMAIVIRPKQLPTAIAVRGAEAGRLDQLQLLKDLEYSYETVSALFRQTLLVVFGGGRGAALGGFKGKKGSFSPKDT